MTCNSPNETNWSSQYKESIQVSNVNNLVNLLFGEHSTASKEIQEKWPNSTVYVEDQVVCLRESVGLNLNSIFHVFHRWEMSMRIFLQQFNSLVSIVCSLDPSRNNQKTFPVLEDQIMITLALYNIHLNGFITFNGFLGHSETYIPVSNSWYTDALLFHTFDKLIWTKTLRGKTILENMLFPCFHRKRFYLLS